MFHQGDASQFADFAIGKVERLYLADLITQTQLSPDHLKALAEALFDFSFATDLGLGRSIAGCQHRSEMFARSLFPRLSTIVEGNSPKKLSHIEMLGLQNGSLLDP